MPQDYPVLYMLHRGVSFSGREAASLIWIEWNQIVTLFAPRRPHQWFLEPEFKYFRLQGPAIFWRNPLAILLPSAIPPRTAHTFIAALQHRGIIKPAPAPNRQFYDP